MMELLKGRFQENLREVMRTYCESLFCELNDLQVNQIVQLSYKI